MRSARPVPSAHDERIVVAGFGRCGSSMMMAMLAAAGLDLHPCSSRAYESDDVKTPRGWERIRGAAKALHPFFPPPDTSPGPFAFIWLDRDPREQAKSAAKFLRVFGRPMTRADRRKLERSFLNDRGPSLRSLREDYPDGSRVLVLSFEEVLANPRAAATQVAKFSGNS